MAVVLFHSAEAWLIMASICGRLLLLGAVRLRFIWDFLDVTVSMTPGGCVGVNLVWPTFRFGRLLWRHRILSRWLWCSKPLALIHYDLSFRWAFVCRSGVVLQCSFYAFVLSSQLPWTDSGTLVPVADDGVFFACGFCMGARTGRFINEFFTSPVTTVCL